MGNSHTDAVSAELRSVEQQVDAYYKGNYLVELPFAVAAWHLMVAWEDEFLGQELRAQATSAESARPAIADTMIFGMQYPFHWLWESCKAGGRVPQTCTHRAYRAAQRLLRVGNDYVPFAIAFTDASRQVVELELHGSTISASRVVRADTRYAAYDLLHRPPEPREGVDVAGLMELVDRSFRDRGGAYRYDLSPRTVKYACEAIAPLVERKFTLPDDWQFEGYSMGDFRKAWACLEAIAYLHHAARRIAVNRDIAGPMDGGSLFVATHEDLLNRVRRYCGVPKAALASLLEDLTYGARGIARPDPAIQPLIRLNDRHYGIMPNLLMASSAERNLTVMLNRVPAQREHYLALVSTKEDLMRKRMKEALALPGFRFFEGRIPGSGDLPDIDLALISDSERLCIVLELKWFIDPAEVREVLEKSEEIRKGISQLLLLRRAAFERGTAALTALHLDSTYELCFAVVSANSIGTHTVQHPEVPVVCESDLVGKVRSTQRLRDVRAWLLSRRFLPEEGSEYEVVDWTYTIGQWSLEWYGIRLLGTPSKLDAGDDGSGVQSHSSVRSQ